MAFTQRWNSVPALATIVCSLVAVIFSISREMAAQEPSPAEQLINSATPGSRTDLPEFLDRSITADTAKDPEAKKADTAKKEFDQEVVNTGKAAFNRGCIKCHDAARSTNKTKDFSGWLATVRRMAAMRDANVPVSDIIPITTYLTSLNPAASPGADGKAESGDKSSFSAFATLLPYWRAGSNNLQDGGFVPETWFGASWHGKILSARVSGCVACHGNKLEPLEAVVRADFSQWLEPLKSGTKGALEAGRFIVPFSAISSSPMEFRTLSRPLIFTMGQLAYADLIGQSVLPMPYTESGIDLNLSTPLFDVGQSEFRVGWDGYVVNGLSGTNTGIDWANSRYIYDANVSPALGTRVTAGIPMLQAGASYVSGHYNQPGASQPGSVATVTGPTGFGGTTTTTDSYAGKLGYSIYGFDLVARYENLLRFQFEYARRSNDRFDSQAMGRGRSVYEEVTGGYYLELEARPTREFPVSAVVRYDRESRTSLLSPTGSYLPGSFDIQRFTWGFNFKLWRDSLLIINHERWFFSANTGLGNLDVFGVRYAINF